MIRDGYICTEEGCNATSELDCHHKHALCTGGDNSLGNLQTLCRKHHRAKHKSWKGSEVDGQSEAYDYAA